MTNQLMEMKQKLEDMNFIQSLNLFYPLMKYYEPTSNPSYKQEHGLVYTFQYEDSFAQIFTTMSGNVSGGQVMQTSFDEGITVPVDHDLTKKHVLFYDDDDINLPFREVGRLVFKDEYGKETCIDLEECGSLLVGIQIVHYQP
ncbi:hypothetical protein P8881_19525 [Bacillus haynesii]|uniref:hypothetical protein n=1 Tax=Bacillus haynesii TaxID=1925021 RepID=UPI00227DC4A4|nr:hypothetical protein [Bacillus haynesii]MCY8737526.1 hypothetical protein [Bacillus haynesii]MEC0709717.1 hypothetical protein [Bacillus haynesii]MEC0736904.1 hypothetical protein [Bacillus haynesii]